MAGNGGPRTATEPAWAGESESIPPGHPHELSQYGRPLSHSLGADPRFSAAILSPDRGGPFEERNDGGRAGSTLRGATNRIVDHLESSSRRSYKDHQPCSDHGVDARSPRSGGTRRHPTWAKLGWVRQAVRILRFTTLVRLLPSNLLGKPEVPLIATRGACPRSGVVCAAGLDASLAVAIAFHYLRC